MCYELGDAPFFRGDSETSYMPKDSLSSGWSLFTDSWSLGNANDCGFKILVVSRMEYNEAEGIHYLFFREASVSKNGNFTAVGAELGATAIMA